MQQQWLGHMKVTLLPALMVFLLAPPLASAQRPVGVVTAVRGSALLTRPGIPRPAGLRFKDDLLIRDIVDTQEERGGRPSGVEPCNSNG